ncbi:MAG: DUF1080 domain-containing protein [Verrucomicrobiota bacterium]
MKRMHIEPSPIGRALLLGLALSVNVTAATLEYSKDGAGIPGYRDTPVQPWSGFHVHDPDRPVAPKVTAGEFMTQDKPGTAPSDAIVLFDGKDMAAWLPTAEWKLDKNELVAGKGLLTTTQAFGSCQLHLEYAAPNPPVGVPFDRGNNGVFMMGMTEIQIFDSYTNKLYADGQAASVYAQTPPLVNACRPPGEWQSYDILWQSPVYAGEKLVQPARLTMLHNGLLVHCNQEVYGTTAHRGLAKYIPQKTSGPLSLMGHNNPVRFRNIWIRPLSTAAP